MLIGQGRKDLFRFTMCLNDWANASSIDLLHPILVNDMYSLNMWI